MTNSTQTAQTITHTMIDVLIEIGTAELPPKALPKLSAAFHEGIVNGLTALGLAPQDSVAYAAPRRLAVWLKQLPNAQAEQIIERRGPALKAAFDKAGNPSKAAQGFARSCGVSVDELERLETPKGTWLSFKKVQAGEETTALMPNLVQQALDKLPIPKRMRWGDHRVEFVRPVHWILMLADKDIISANLFNCQASNVTYGHRFHHPDAIVIDSPADYASRLQQQGKVIASFQERKSLIQQQVETVANALNAHAQVDADLLDEVTALVEWPVALSGDFDEKFLNVPQEALISAMQDHQKYFPVVDAKGKLKAHFITVANIESSQPATIRQGNERVIRPRFSDAEFFWQQDQKQPLVNYAERSKTIVFQKQLGTLYEKTQRVAALSQFMGQQLPLDDQQLAHLERAAQLAKCDLMTDMVGEFPELQGIMGRYYALNDGENSAVAEAMAEQYLPRFAGDALPQGYIGQILSVADRMDTLCGIFAIGQKPTGTKDPFGLRRAALGVLRIMIEAKLALDLRDVLTYAAQQLSAKVDASAQLAETEQYIVERLRAYYQDAGIASDSVETVARIGITAPLDFDQRVRAVNRFRHLPEAESLAAANKRIANLLKKVEGDIPATVNPSLFVETQESALYDALQTQEQSVANFAKNADYEQALRALAQLKPQVDAFFDHVMVMADDEQLKNNRLALLKQLRQQFLQIADVSYLQC